MTKPYNFTIRQKLELKHIERLSQIRLNRQIRSMRDSMLAGVKKDRINALLTKCLNSNHPAIKEKLKELLVIAALMYGDDI